MERLIMVRYMGVTSGTFMGRDDGYPEEKERKFKNIDDVAKANIFGTLGKEEEWFTVDITPVNKELIGNEIKNAGKRIAKKKKAADLSAKKEQLAKLQREIKEAERER